MLGWYKGESWRLFPNIEFIKDSEEGFWITFAFCKFVFDIKICIG